MQVGRQGWPGRGRQPLPLSRPLHAWGSSRLHVPLPLPSRPRGTAPVCDGEESSDHVTGEGSAWPLPCPEQPPNPQSLSSGKASL